MCLVFEPFLEMVPSGSTQEWVWLVPKIKPSPIWFLLVKNGTNNSNKPNQVTTQH
jgi:hypothetical protein